MASDRTSRGPSHAILKAWLLAGTLDILAAVGQYIITTGRAPTVVFLYIASGLFGRDAYEGGAGMVITGGIIHYLIALGWTLLFFVAYPRVRILRNNRFTVGIAYGLLIWLVMNNVVLPLSRVQLPPFDLGRALVGILILMACVGLPVSYGISSYYRTSSRTTSTVV